MKVKIEKLREDIISVISKKYSKEDAERIADVAMFGQMSGKVSHGLVRVLIGDSSVMHHKAQGGPEIVKKTQSTEMIQGNGNPGMLLGAIAMENVIDLAQKSGMGMVGTKGTFSTSGCLSYYLYHIAKAGLVSMVFARSPRIIAAHRGIEPMFGTNPIGFGIPTSGEPLIFDMGTSAISYGEVIRRKIVGEDLPEGVAINKEGDPTTKPEEAMSGAFLTFDNGYKGAGLAMMVEIMAGALLGSGFTDIDDENGWGNLFFAYNPDAFGDPEQMKSNVTALINRVKTSSNTGENLRIVGERTINKYLKSIKEGEVEVDDKLIQELEKHL